MTINNIIKNKPGIVSFEEIKRILMKREEVIYRKGFDDGYREANRNHKELLRLCRKENK